MATKRVITQGVKQVRPILSVDRTDARRRVLNLYKAWYRQIPYMTGNWWLSFEEISVFDFNLPVTVPQAKAKLRELFLKNKHVTDIRAIDMLVIKGQMDLVETANIWKQRNHVMMFFKDTHNPKPTDFLTKFYEGQD